MMTQHEWPEAHRKRGREEEYADVSPGGTLGFTEHRSKRLQALPFRTSPTSKRWAAPPNFLPSQPSFSNPAPPRTITPGESDSDEPPTLQEHDWAPEPEMVHEQLSLSAAVSEPVDRDMDMMDTSEPPLGPEQAESRLQTHLQPGQFQPDQAAPTTVTGRVPTPIHCSFAAQVRGNNWGGAAGNVMQGGNQEDGNALALNGNRQMEAYQGSNMVGHESIPRSLDGSAAAEQVMSHWNMVQNRRLPSPISESGCEDGIESPRMVLDSSAQHVGHLDQVAHQHPLVSSLGPRASSSAEHLRPTSDSSQGEDSSVVEGNSGNAMDVESPATPSPRKGHTRSRHTVNSWTALQPGMKRSFSIGYRADCEKCRMKVPGHFNHIIIS
ncbi:hypothetical protein QBC46DRAFT_69776 [Diplogelasinospora grovesii]|uniref:Uncharacterized protein n=1 Tax=Diplogelasinospora grovesii TaxID=303347 RepID=A0AAN6NBD8_9PEZI|nr:hypothetical protein QBC46DRAFT_69776 [Diplogelasinospora grovesii]